MAHRKTFVFASDTGTGIAVEARAANALEFIAHYLDQIDGHLEAIADHLRSGHENSAKIALSLQGVQHLMARMEK